MTKHHGSEIAEIVSNALADIRADMDHLCVGLAIVMMQTEMMHKGKDG